MLLLALESGIPEELAWALNGLLLASCDGSAAAVERLDRPLIYDTVSLVKNPQLLRALLPLAVAPAGS